MVNISTADIELSVVSNLCDIAPEAWDRLAGDDNPFLEHAFLAGLELTECVGPHHTGWVPAHVVAYLDKVLVGALPLYEKFDSFGEYIFDWAWAQAAQRGGLSYYPKLVSAVPFTPVTAQKLLLAPELTTAAAARVARALMDGLQQVASDRNSSSAHLLFVAESEMLVAMSHAYHPRSSYQFHWIRDPEWKSFDDYLSAMRASTRKQIRRERRRAAGHGLELSTIRGDAMSSDDWDALWFFYNETQNRKWGSAYLNREFFGHLREHMSHRVVASFAHREGTAVAGALLLTKGDRLFGRYWGSRVPLDSMHFELCYYQPIEWALANGITRFEAGAQGEHKLKRGFLPVETLSAHWLRDPPLNEAVGRFLPQERNAVREEIAILTEHSPFRC